MKRRLYWWPLLIGVALFPSLALAEGFTYMQLLQDVLGRDASLEVAGKRLERARQEFARVEGQLGWVLNARAGVNRDTSLFGTPTDRTELAAGVERRLRAGGTLGLSGSYAREDATTPMSPTLPNPSDNTRLDLSYRYPLAQGADNPDYREGRRLAQAGEETARAAWSAQRDQLARRTAELFYAAALTRARLRSSEEAVGRAERLLAYVTGNVRLGVAEAKDSLQAQAQLEARRAEHEGLLLAWTQQRTSLNRLLERPWDAKFEPVLVERAPLASGEREAVHAQSRAASAELQRLSADVVRAEAVIERARDSARDRLDLVGSIGQRNLSGDVPLGGSVDRTEVVGGLRLEYRAAIDDQGLQAEVTQAQIDRSIALRARKGVEDDLAYQLDGLLAELDAASRALSVRRRHFSAEDAKVEEAITRYRRGRTDTAQLIQFENDRQAASLAVDQQDIELARRRLELEILRGALWAEIRMPEGAP